MNYFYYQKNYLKDQSIQKKIELISKKTSLAGIDTGLEVQATLVTTSN